MAKKKDDKKKLAGIIFGVVCAVIVVVCVIIQIVMNNETAKLEKEGEKFDTLVVETPSGVSIETEYTRVDGEDFFFKVPTSFKRLDDETLDEKYAGDVPSLVFSNDDTTVNLAINLTENELDNAEIKDYYDFFLTLSEEYGEILDSEYYNLSDHNIGRIKWVSNIEEEKIYNDMLFFSNDGELVILAFNCPENLKTEWENVGDFLLDSLFFKLED